MSEPGPGQIEQERAHQGLSRVLGFWTLTIYGVSVIIGAGVYVALGEVFARAGAAAPLSFLLAGAAAGLTGLCYADLASRWPHAAGAALFAERGFRSALMGRLVGLALLIAVGVAAASIGSGAVKFAGAFIAAPPWAMMSVLIIGFTLLAAAGVRESTGFAAIIGLIEVAGLVAAIATGLVRAPACDLAAFVPNDAAQWSGVGAGAFIAFFAFIGFEALANMGEETLDPVRTLPRAILAAVAISVILYVLVAGAAIWGGSAGDDNPLLALFDGSSALVFAMVGALAIANGALVEIVMLSRLCFGMAQNGRAPAFLGLVNARTRTPVAATFAAGAFVLAIALLLPFERLLVLSNVLTLGVFATVNIALIRVRKDPSAPPAGMPAPAWAPPLATLMTIGLVAWEFL
jgi:APA family basic amino acid/polyamine antiporter